jgi:thiosulfate dehydrogenase
MLLALQVGAGEKGAPLTDQHKMMMKNGAMKNMDKYMGSQEARMKELPKAMMSKQKSLVMNGKALFSDTGLGANGQSCASCHPGGGTVGGTVDTPMASELTGKPYSLPVPSLIGAAATFPKFKVPNDRVITVHEMANNCVMMFMGAVPPEIGSPDSNAIGAYLYSLSAGEPVEPGKMPEMMKKMMEGGMGDMGAGS